MKDRGEKIASQIHHQGGEKTEREGQSPKLCTCARAISANVHRASDSIDNEHRACSEQCMDKIMLIALCPVIKLARYPHDGPPG